MSRSERYEGIGIEGDIYTGKTTLLKNLSEAKPGSLILPETGAFMPILQDWNDLDAQNFEAFQYQVLMLELRKSQFAHRLSLDGFTVFLDRTLFSPMIYTLACSFIKGMGRQRIESLAVMMRNALAGMESISVPQQLLVLTVDKAEQFKRSDKDFVRNSEPILFHQVFSQLYEVLQSLWKMYHV
jgi:deoxyadenosine/deoxycytidine kinase